jgi:hypothetical protein
VTIRTQIRALGQGYVYTGVLVRDTFYGPEQQGGNLYAGISTGPGLAIGYIFNDTWLDLAKVPTALNVATTDVNLEFSVAGSSASLFAWEAGTQKPSSPQLSLSTLPSLIPSQGRVGILNYGRLPRIPTAFRYFEVEGVPESSTPTFSLSPAAGYVVQDSTSGGVVDDFGDAVGTLITARVGEIDSPGSNLIERVVEKFLLPSTPGLGDRLESAVLRVFVQQTRGTPAGPLSLWHSVSDNDLAKLPSDFEDSSYIDTQLGWMPPTDTLRRYFELDVTDQVRADYAADGANPLAAFRLQVNEAQFLEDDISSYYLLTARLDDFGGGNPPLLMLSFRPVPEPRAVGLPCVVILCCWGARPQSVRHHSS